LRNTFQLVLNSAVTSKTEDQRSSEDTCRSELETEHQNSQGSLSWFQISVDNVALYGTFLPVGVVDTRTTTLQISYEQVSTKTEKEGIVTVSSPVFFEKLVVDPNFAVLLVPSSDSSCNSNSLSSKNRISKIDILAIALAIGGATVVGVATALALKRYYIKRDSPLRRKQQAARKVSPALTSMNKSKKNAAARKIGQS